MTVFSGKSLSIFAGAGLALVALSGCSDFRQAIGSEKSVPDEFEVVVRPPLTLPPNFSARPSANDKDDRIVSTADLSASGQLSVLLESRKASLNGYEDVFDFSGVPADIRDLVDEETAGIRFERRLPIQIVFGGLPDVGPILDQMAEDARLRSNRLQGRVPTDGASPATDGVEGTEILVK